MVTEHGRRWIMRLWVVLALWLLAGLAFADGPQVYVVDMAGTDLKAKLAVTSLQGLVNRQGGQELIYLLSRPDDGIWLDTLQHRYRFPTVDRTPQQLIDKFKGRARGQVIYDPQQPFTINIATMQAGLGQAIISDKDLGLPTSFDGRGKWKDELEAYRWAKDNLLEKCNRSRLAFLKGEATDLRDYVIGQKMFVCDVAPIDEQAKRELLEQILEGFPSGSLIMGRAGAEGQNQQTWDDALARLATSSQ